MSGCEPNAIPQAYHACIPTPHHWNELSKVQLTRPRQVIRNNT